MSDEEHPVQLVIEVDSAHGVDLFSRADPEESPCVRISNPDAENGYDECRGPLAWLNSARLSVNSDEDSVSCVISVGDPRGGFCFTVRQLADGRIVLHMPHPDESMPHMTTEVLHPGTLVVL
jgi:hypothetical protein